MIGKRILQVGTMCLVSPALLHRDPRWWAEPEQFRPDRWVRRVQGKADRFDPKAPGQPRGAYLPFGAGPRMCIGEQFLVGGHDDTGRAGPHMAPPRPRCSACRRPIVDDVAAERCRARDDVTATAVTWSERVRPPVRRLATSKAIPAALFIPIREPGRIEPAAGVGQSVHGLPLPGLCFGEMPLRGDLVPSRFYPLGVERVQRVDGGLHRPRRPRGRIRTASARPQRRRVRPRPGAAGNLLPPLRSAGPESSSSANAAAVTSTSSTAQRPATARRRAASSSSTAGRSGSVASVATSACCGSLAPRACRCRHVAAARSR